MKDLCIKCKTKPVHIRSRGLCKECVQVYYLKKAAERKKANMPPSDYRKYKIQHTREIDFIRNFFNHKNWLYQPAHFRLNGCGYQPDFYDGERNTFIEVAGTRQAFHANLEKYKEFVRTFPKINFEIRQVNGDLIDLNAEKYHIDDNSQK